MTSSASISTAVDDTRIGVPLSQAPTPRSAVKSSWRLGSNTAPTTASPSISSASEAQKIGTPCAKLVVPSSGSKTQRWDRPAVAAPPISSARMS